MPGSDLSINYGNFLNNISKVGAEMVNNCPVIMGRMNMVPYF